MRTGWLISAAVVMYAAVIGGVYSMYWYAYHEMMDIWGVTEENISRAPWVVQFLYGWSNTLVCLFQYIVLALLSGGLEKWAGVESEKKCPERHRELGRGAGMGMLCMIVLWGILLLSGSMRLGWRLSRPAFSVNTLALLLTTAVTAFGEGCFAYGAFRESMKKRLPGWAALGIVVLFGGMSALLTGGMHPMTMVCGVAMAFACCTIGERFGLYAVVGFVWSWEYFGQAVFGFPGSAAALYETYPVNLYWLNGGNGGVMQSWLATVLLGLVGLYLMRREIVSAVRKKNGKSAA